jgi:hypothetical protein
MLNYPPEHPRPAIKPPKKEDEKVIMEKEEVIDILKTLEGLKRKLQPLLK